MEIVIFGFGMKDKSFPIFLQRLVDPTRMCLFDIGQSYECPGIPLFTHKTLDCTLHPMMWLASHLCGLANIRVDTDVQITVYPRLYTC